MERMRRTVVLVWEPNKDWRRQSKTSLETSMPPCVAKLDTANDTEVEFDLPVSVLDRLIKSRIVPREAKLKSIESWQRELAECSSNSRRTLELANRLALAKNSLVGRPLRAAIERPFGLTARMLRWWNTDRSELASAHAGRPAPRRDQLEGLRPA